MPVKINYKVPQGATFREVLRWETSTKVYVPITGITKAAPAVVSAVGHGMPVGWRFQITNVVGMTDINSTDVYHIGTSTTTDTITINALNSLGYKDYISGGVVTFNQSTNLTGYTARMQIRGKLEDTAIIKELTTENGGIVIDTVAKTITLIITAADTTAFTFASAVYSLELISSGGEVHAFTNGNLSLIKEVTR